MKHFFTHWITSLGGLLLAAGNLSVNGMTGKQFLIGLGIAALGAIAKDPNKH